MLAHLKEATSSGSIFKLCPCFFLYRFRVTRRDLLSLVNHLGITHSSKKILKRFEQKDLTATGRLALNRVPGVLSRKDANCENDAGPFLVTPEKREQNLREAIIQQRRKIKNHKQVQELVVISLLLRYS
jgi:hypothetical protein